MGVIRKFIELWFNWCNRSLRIGNPVKKSCVGDGDLLRPWETGALVIFILVINRFFNFRREAKILIHSSPAGAVWRNGSVRSLTNFEVPVRFWSPSPALNSQD